MKVLRGLEVRVSASFACCILACLRFVVLPIVAQPPDARKGLTAIAGIRIGHYPLDTRPTQCTVVLSKDEAAATVDVTEGARNGENTAIGIVDTNGSLGKEQLAIVARMAHVGLARAARIAHSTPNGGTNLAIGTNEIIDKVSMLRTGVLAAKATVRWVLAGTNISGHLLAEASSGGVR